MFGYLTTLFRDRPAGAERIDIVIDRRHEPEQKAPEMERRRPSARIDDELRKRGFAFVVQPGEAFSPRDAARIERTVELLAGMEERSWPFRRRRRRPLWRRLQRLWTHRPWKPLAALGAVALVSTLFATEFRITDYRDDRPAKASRPAAAGPTVATPPASAPAPLTPPPAPASPRAVETAAPAASVAVATATATPIPPAPRATPASPATIKAAEYPASGSTFFSPLPAAPATPRPAVNGPTETAVIPAVSAAPAARTVPATSVRPAAATAPAPAATPTSVPDLRLEMSRRPTSATGGGFVYTVRVLDRDGEPRSDAQVWLAPGGRANGTRFQTRMHPAEAAGTYRSGVVHPSTLPPDMVIKAQVGSHSVEAALER
ncbi:MAG TPA: hypothetical protein VJU81_06360 [Methylomirabilota bacterium]|nr:hypothetical protein [Methylomirabilota bacterium]